MTKLTVLVVLGAGMVVSALAADWSGYIIDPELQASKKGMWGNVVHARRGCIKKGAAANPGNRRWHGL